MVAVSSWGRLSQAEHSVVCLTNRNDIVSTIGKSKPGAVYGMGRSYGDVCLNPNGTLWNTSKLDRFIGFDQSSGRLICESGVLLRDIQRLVIPRGWMLPVTPGTQLITVGGAIANDVHGKNHHFQGAFGNHVRRMTLARTDGEVIECGPGLREDWFFATIGGIGLTGLIIEAEIQLRRVPGPWLDVETIPYSNLDDFFHLANSSENDWEYTISWIDCTSNIGRGLFSRGNHSSAASGPIPSRRSKRMPIIAPVSIVNKPILQSFNTAYYGLGRLRAGLAVTHYEPFLYPLDSVLDWNYMYGPKGFFQYQCVIPKVSEYQAIRMMLQLISESGSGSFLAVLKTFGDYESLGMLSFPRWGTTLALDFPNRGKKVEKLFRQLDAIVLEYGGRIYLAKDARMSKQCFEKNYPEHTNFLSYRDPDISSAMSRRLMAF